MTPVTIIGLTFIGLLILVLVALAVALLIDGIRMYRQATQQREDEQ